MYMWIDFERLVACTKYRQQRPLQLAAGRKASKGRDLSSHSSCGTSLLLLFYVYIYVQCELVLRAMIVL